MSLYNLVIQSAQRHPDAVAIQGPDGSLTYGELDRLSNRFGRLLMRLGVQTGDHVGIWLEKSTRTVAAMQGIVRLSAVYVPLDPLSPASRVSTIVQDCAIHVLITTRKRATALFAHNAELAGRLVCCCLDDPGEGCGWYDLLALSGDALPQLVSNMDDIAYILYTSGSTGKPKGVCISNRNALAFVEWAAAEVGANSSDRLANHAPFHFDLSVFDLYVSFLVGACVLLIPDDISYIPGGLIRFIAEESPTIWYSVPSVLILMMEQRKLFDIKYLHVRALLFAGEPFPTRYLRSLYEQWQGVRFFNFYGPTETNVCTSYEVTEGLPENNEPVPIGRACSGDQVWAQKDDGSIAAADEEGELMVSGPTVMVGYWGQPKQGEKPYATGDIVRVGKDGNYRYLGRRDHLIKVRGYRVEPGDIESALHLHPAIREVAVIIEGTGMMARLVACMVISGGEAPSLLEIKRHCAQYLPRYMIVDAIRILPHLPRTRNGKVDRLALSTCQLETTSTRRTGE